MVEMERWAEDGGRLNRLGLRETMGQICGRGYLGGSGRGGSAGDFDGYNVLMAGDGGWAERGQGIAGIVGFKFASANKQRVL